MGRLNIVIDDELEKNFRIELAKRGYKKGNISKAVSRGIIYWMTIGD